MNDPIIRKARPDDLPAVVSLVYELAEYEKEPHMMTADLETYQRSYHAGDFEAFVAEVGGHVVGIAIYYQRFSTWKGPMLHLEDFIVTEPMRGRGIGKLLFERFLEEGRQRGSALCIWHVLDWNAPAINFYDKYDVVYDKDWYGVKYYFDNK